MDTLAAVSLSAVVQKFTNANSTQKAFVALFGICASMILDYWDLIFMVTGITGFMFMDAFQKSVKLQKGKGKTTKEVPAKCLWKTRTSDKGPQVPKDQRQFIFQPSVNPATAPTFASTGFENEVHELLDQLYLSPACDSAIRGVEEIVRKTISPLIPGATIKGFACSNLIANKAFAVALPELDIVIEADEEVFLKMLGERVDIVRTHDGLDQQRFNMVSKKSFLRICRDALTQHPGNNVKFRRTAFSGDDHKITLLIPASAGISKANIPFNVSINCTTPQNGVAMLNEMQQQEPRAHQLALLVRRWARDRAISHCSKGGLTPYTWSVLCFKFIHMYKAHKDVSTMSVTELFHEFIRFHLSDFDWCAGIPDPFDATQNVARSLSTAGRSRLQEELKRAHQICSSNDPSITELITPWAPDKTSADYNSAEA